MYYIHVLIQQMLMPSLSNQICITYSRLVTELDAIITIVNMNNHN